MADLNAVYADFDSLKSALADLSAKYDEAIGAFTSVRSNLQGGGLQGSTGDKMDEKINKMISDLQGYQHLLNTLSSALNTAESTFVAADSSLQGITPQSAIQTVASVFSGYL